MSPPSPSAESIPSVVDGFMEKERREIESRNRLLDDLLNQRIHFSSWPYEAHIQFSNFCNMSCIMCWDGRNPPAEKASPELLARISEQIAPHLSVMTPYSGSEPLVWSWQETRAMAEENSVLLCITTNGQYLTEKRFHELRSLTETLLISIDSHIPQVLEIIRPGGDIHKVFANLETTASLCREYQLECIVNVVLMTHNAPHLAQTIEYLGGLGIETVNIIQLLDVNGRSQFLDPLIHFSSDYMQWIKTQCLRATESKQMRLIWSVSGCTEYDYRTPNHVKPHARKTWNDAYDERTKRLFPGFCRYVLNRLRIDGQGDVAPCCYATQGKLSLGNILESDFDEIWNGLEAKDLRRGMLCGDVPAHCSTCRYIDTIAPQTQMDFVESTDQQVMKRFRKPDSKIQDHITGLGPDHATRLPSAPTLSLTPPEFVVKEYLVAISLGGETDEIHEMRFPQSDLVDPSNLESIELQIPDSIWGQLKANVGYWWNVWAVPADKRKPVQRAKCSYCFIKHQSLPRLNSKLKYPDSGTLPIIDLGVSKQHGWQNQDQTPDRPVTEEKAVAPDDLAKERITGPVVPVNLPVEPATESIWKSLGQLVFKKRNHRPKSVPAPASPVLNGFVDQVVKYDGHLHLEGWLLLKTGPLDSIRFVSDRDEVVAKQVLRPDLESAYSSISGAANSGFSVKLKSEDFETHFGYEFSLVGVLNDEEVCRVKVTRIENEDSEQPPQGPYWIGTRTRLNIH